ncbi:MAG TPA: hypothetical protein VFA26_10040 [Gemmataceae bacterium]|nr:hypothetical protein [Gemmataceae bacterium]
MRRLIFSCLAILEFAIAAVLVAFGCYLPSTGEVHQSFSSVERATRRSGGQVHNLRNQVHELRRPEIREMSVKLKEQTLTVSSALRKQKIDYQAVEAISDSLGQAAGGLDELSETLDPKAVGKIGDGLGATADYLDQRVIPTASKAADHLDGSTAVLRKDAARLSVLLRQSAPDLQAAQEIHDGLARFSDGLDAVNRSLKMQHLEAMREGFKGLEDSLTTGAEQVERLSGCTYPVVTFNGLRPEVEQRKFWPEGDQIAEGMRKAAAGVKAAGKELDRISADLPKLRGSLEESRKVADRTRLAMAEALRQRDKVEPLLKEVPEHAAKLAEDLPALSAGLAKVLRDTQGLQEIAASLRQAQKGIDAAVKRWPELRTTLSRSAGLLRATQAQMRQVLDNRQEYESALRQMIRLADIYAYLLPVFVDQLDRHLEEQERSLAELGQSIDEVSEAVPVYERTATRIVQTGKLLSWLVAGIVGLHGAYLMLSVRLGRRYSW